MSRQQFEVRVRENGVKKSRFYEATDSKDAAAKYHGSGFVMWVRKVEREKIQGVGEFFSLGDRLLKEFAQQGGEAIEDPKMVDGKMENKKKVELKRWYHSRERFKEA